MTYCKEQLRTLSVDTPVRLYLFSGHTIVGKVNEFVDGGVICLYREADHTGPFEHHCIDIDAVVGWTIFGKTEGQA